MRYLFYAIVFLYCLGLSVKVAMDPRSRRTTRMGLANMQSLCQYQAAHSRRLLTALLPTNGSHNVTQLD